MTPPKPVDYAMVTVKLDKPAMERTQAFQEIKTALCLKTPDIDESYGAIPMGRGDEYVVLIEENLANKMKDDKHPNIIGVFANPKMEPFLRGDICNPPSMPPGGCIPPEPPKTRGGPRRNPKP
ncbi:MAG: hypothetical protein ACAH83_15790 [Alphaproteobacteria bacterium]